MITKKILLTIFTSWCVCMACYSQDANTIKNCFDDYSYSFKTRGTYPVPDGMQQVAVAVVDVKGNAKCYLGQIIVKGGSIVLPLYIPREDGSMTQTSGVLDNSFYREAEGKVSYKIENAMSPVYYLQGKRKARLFFTEFVKPEPGRPIEAPAMNSRIVMDTLISKEELSTISEHAHAIQFETGKAIIASTSNTALDAIVEIMKQHPDDAWLIDGYTDNTGNDNSNRELSEKRAQAVANYFVRKGIKPDHLFAAGHGEDQPIADNATPEGRAQNRRVEIAPLKK